MSLESILGIQRPKMEAMPTPPSRSSAEVEDARRRALQAEGKTRGPAATYLTGGGPMAPASVAQKFLTGQ